MINVRCLSTRFSNIEKLLYCCCRSQVYSVDGEQRQVLNAEYIREREQMIQPLVDLKLYDQVYKLTEIMALYGQVRPMAQGL